MFETLRMVAWSLALPVLKHVIPIRRLVCMMWSPGTGARSPDRVQAVISLSARVTRARPNCLERSLLAYRFLSRTGADPRLVLGIGRLDGTLSGHAWVTLDGVPVHEAPEAISGFTPLVEFGPDGRPVDLRAGEMPGLPRVWR